MNNKKIIYFGLITMGIYLIISSIVYFIGAKSDFCISCFLTLTIINFLPLLLKTKGYSLILVSSVFYFLLGALIGYLVQKFKKS